MQEVYYGFKLCTDVIRKITLEHSSRISSHVKEADDLPDKQDAQILISEADGGMIPIAVIHHHISE